jgi:hypothetical protein
MNKKALSLALMVMFFFITTALFLAAFSSSKDTRSRASTGDYGNPNARITPTSGVNPIISKYPRPISPRPTNHNTPILRPSIYKSPTPKPPIPTPTPVETIKLDKTSVSVILNRSNAVSGLVFGSGFTITSIRANGWAIKFNEPTQGQGFYESSGGIVPGSSTTIRTYINTNKPNGTYTGSAIIQYAVNGNWYDGPTVTYSITLQ